MTFADLAIGDEFHYVIKGKVYEDKFKKIANHKNVGYYTVDEKVAEWVYDHEHKVKIGHNCCFCPDTEVKKDS